jgi:hypothetical protein
MNTCYLFGSTALLSTLFPNRVRDFTTLIFGVQFKITKLLVFHFYALLSLPNSAVVFRKLLPTPSIKRLPLQQIIK